MSQHDDDTAPSGAPPEPEGPFWPDTPPRLSPEGLVEFTGDLVAGRLFTSRDLPSFVDCVPGFTDEFASVWPFWGLVLEMHGMPPETFALSVGVFYSYRADASSIQRNDLPTYIQLPQVLHREDWLIVCKAIERAKERSVEPFDSLPITMHAYKAIHRAAHALHAIGRWRGGPNALADLTPQLVVENFSHELLLAHGDADALGEIEVWIFESAGLKLKAVQGDVAAHVRARHEIVKLLEHVEADTRLGYEPVAGDPPQLAAIQSELATRVEVLEWVLARREHGGGSAGMPE